MKKKVIVGFLIISIVFSSVLAFAGCKKQKKAMILIHGICGGALYDAETNKPVYAMDAVNLKEISEMFTSPEEMVDKLSLDEDGKPLHNLRLAKSDEVGKFTLLSMFEPLYNALNENFGKEYDVIVWQYDWRLDNYQTAKKLEDFIAKNGYDKVQFFSHSMGGNVVSQYLANSEVNRKKVELFVPFSTPFFGSNEVYNFIYEGMFSNPRGVLNSIPVDTPANRVDITATYDMGGDKIDIVKPYLKKLGANVPSMFMLSPFKEYYNDSIYENGESPVKYNGKYLNYDEVIKHYTKMKCAKKSNGELKPGYALLKDYQNNQMVDYKGERVHISRTINTHYIQGKGVDTLKSITVNGVNLVGTEYTKMGDGQVAIYSGTAGLGENAKNVYIMENSSHISIITDKCAVDTAIDIVNKFLRR